MNTLIPDALCGLLAEAGLVQPGATPTLGAHLTMGLPRTASDDTSSEIGPRLVYWPTGICRQRRIGIASSRLRRPWHHQNHWFDALREIACSLADEECLFSAVGTATEPFVRRCPQLFGTPALILHFSEWAPTAKLHLPTALRKWWRQVQSARVGDDPGCITAYVSPRLWSADDTTTIGFIGDQAIAAWSERLELVQVRPDGTWDTLLQRILRRADRGPPEVRISGDERLVANDLRASYERQGAVARSTSFRTKPKDAPDNVRPKAGSARSQAKDMAGTGTARLPGLEDLRRLAPIEFDRPVVGEYLTHWTRAPRAGWCDQSPTDYVDELLRGESIEPRTSLDALLRMISKRRICGSSRLIRGGFAVVSLTAVPLEQLPTRRAYRRHLTRFDFEPYGICLRRSFVERLGGRPVIYGTDADWAALPAAQRQFFQRARSSNSSNIDWTLEQEWRCGGDLDLSCCQPQDAWVFAATQADVERLQCESPWPVIGLWEFT